MEYKTVVVDLLIALQRNQDKGIPEKMLYAGGNTGNLVFTESVKKQVQYEKEIWLNPTALKGVENPAVIIPSANFIRVSDTEMVSNLIRFLENTDCPVTAVGLGAQAAEGVSPAGLVKQLTETHIRAFKMLSERAVSIGVRGEYTAQCLNQMGIHNVQIIGCPSFYFRRGSQSHRLKIPSLRKVQMTLTPGDAKEALILKQGMKADAFWVMQMMSENPELALECKVWNSDVEAQVRAMRENCFKSLSLTEQDLWDYMRRKCRMFFDMASWEQFYDTEDVTFAFGSRFHGNMAAFRSGVTTLWIVHDTRTRELVETLHLPYIDYVSLAEIHDPQELIERCDYRDYERHYEGLYNQYIEFLEENHLKTK